MSSASRGTDPSSERFARGVPPVNQVLPVPIKPPTAGLDGDESGNPAYATIGFGGPRQVGDGVVPLSNPGPTT